MEEPVIIEGVDYPDARDLPDLGMGHVFRYCNFKDMELETGPVDASFIGCVFQDLDWYWGLFNCCILVDVSFERCTFRGTNFADCRFLNCTFTNCRFVHDNLDSPCHFEGSQWFDCRVGVGNEGLPLSLGKLRKPSGFGDR
ncbi:pentapeptide repeat-containing protein [Leeia sp.]|uniref:pentapeptide repeat-containing protein n=1 Tax=Leeia sp. TaxID=2884678 RepID=UPI0035B08987